MVETVRLNHQIVRPEQTVSNPPPSTASRILIHGSLNMDFTKALPLTRKGTLSTTYLNTEALRVSLLHRPGHCLLNVQRTQAPTPSRHLCRPLHPRKPDLRVPTPKTLHRPPQMKRQQNPRLVTLPRLSTVRSAPCPMIASTQPAPHVRMSSTPRKPLDTGGAAVRFVRGVSTSMRATAPFVGSVGQGETERWSRL